MSLIMKNGIPYGARKHSLAYCAGRAISDANGDPISSTYVKKSDVDALIDQNTPVVDNAGYHNSVLRLKDITSKFTSGDLYEVIADGTFKDLYVGDYFKATYAGTEKTFRIAGFNLYMGTGDEGHEVVDNHITVITDEALQNAAMNSSNTTANGYYNSAMRQSVIPTINTNLRAIFGDHLMTTRELLSNAMNSSVRSSGYPGTGAASGYAWYDSIAELLSEVEVYGGPAFGSSMYDIGVAKSQFPLFKLGPQFINPGRFDWWLRSVVSSACFALVDDDGYAILDNASHSFGVRPRLNLF